MYRHTPSILRGPISRTRGWWKLTATESDLADEFRRLRPQAVDEIRTELITRVRREIAEGRYDTPEKWDAALDRLLARLGSV